MAKLIVGRFDNVDDLKRVLEALRNAGFEKREYGSFYVAPPGQHALHPGSDDAHSDEGAKDAGEGAVAGAAIGGAAGLAVGAVAVAAIPIAGIAAAVAAAGIGAYIGSLAGALSKTEDGDETQATREQPVERPGGPRVAVYVERPGAQARAIEILERFGAKDISHAEGEWRDRVWKDFDPHVPPERVNEDDEAPTEPRHKTSAG